MGERDSTEPASTGDGIFEAAILVGGSSRRAGRDKAFLEIDGRPLLEHLLRQTSARFRRTIVSVARGEVPPGVEAICERLESSNHSVAVVPDRRDGRPGPLGAIEAILSALEGPGVFVTAVDNPELDHDLIEFLLVAAASSHGRGVVPEWSSGTEPLFAVYSRDLLTDVGMLLDRGHRRADAPMTLAGVRRVSVLNRDEAPPPSSDLVWRTVRDPAQVFRNLNTEDDYREYLASRRR